MRSYAGLIGTSFLTVALLAACGSETNDVPPDAPIVNINDAAPDARPDAMPLPDAFVPPDARIPALGCLGDPLPTTASDPVSISGTASTISQSGQMPLAGVTVTAHLVSDDTEVAGPETTGTSGDFSISVATGGTPLAGYVKLVNPADTTYLVTRVYPPTPVSMDLTGNQGLMLNDGILTFLSFVGITHDASTKGIVGILVLDCNGDPVNGATVSLNPSSGQIVYNGSTGIPDTSATMTAGDGIAIVFNADEGDVEIGATVGGMELRKHTIKSLPRTISTAAIAP